MSVGNHPLHQAVLFSSQADQFSFLAVQKVCAKWNSLCQLVQIVKADSSNNISPLWKSKGWQITSSEHQKNICSDWYDWWIQEPIEIGKVSHSIVFAFQIKANKRSYIGWKIWFPWNRPLETSLKEARTVNVCLQKTGNKISSLISLDSTICNLGLLF